MQGGLDFRLSIIGIASVQKTCRIDPKVLANCEKLCGHLKTSLIRTFRATGEHHTECSTRPSSDPRDVNRHRGKGCSATALLANLHVTFHSSWERLFSIQLDSGGLKRVAGTNERPGSWGDLRNQRYGGGSTKKEPTSTHELLFPCWSGFLMRGSSFYLMGWGTSGLMACAGGRVPLGHCDPIQVPGPRRPWLSCVGESGSRCVDALGIERRGAEAGQAP
jgi:hypothetical protein